MEKESEEEFNERMLFLEEENSYSARFCPICGSEMDYISKKEYDYYYCEKCDYKEDF